MNTKEEAVKKIILKKFKKISDLEKKIWENVNSIDLKVLEKYFINSQIFACVDGFVLIRYFNLISNSFTITPVNQRISIFSKNIPIYSIDNNVYNFPIQPGIGGSFTMGLHNNERGFVTINEVKFPPFQLKVESNQKLSDFTDEMEELILFFEQDITVKEANDKLKILFDENYNLKSRFENIHTPLIITEGKTDWRHIIRALKYFNSKNEFLNIKETFFLRYGSIEDVNDQICDSDCEEAFSNSKLEKYLSSSIDNRKLDKGINKSIRIGIFDSDDAKIKLSNDKEVNIFSFEIQPKNISIEFLYSDAEIKSLVNNRRLYIGSEFNSKSKRHLTENLVLGGDNNSTNKSGKRVIVDKDVFNFQDENISLTKSAFSEAVFNDEIKVSNESWENFRHIFGKINEALSVKS